MGIQFPLRVSPDERLRVRQFSSTTASLGVRIRMTSDRRGEKLFRPIDLTATDTTANKTAQDTVIDIPTGWIQGGSVFARTETLKRGQAFAGLSLFHFNLSSIRLFQGYIYPANAFPFGHFEHPTSGKGYLDWVQEANDAAGNATTTVNLAATNTRRIVRAVIIKYHQTGGSAATITITLRDLADSGGPTNWSIASDTWVSPDLVLGANEEGLMHVGEHGFLSTNDAGTLAYADNTTAPNPFPLLVEEGDPVDLIIAASGGASGDDYDVWVQYEEWLEF